ncbi:N-acetylmuramoyl-L-alanine amidase [Rhinichthys klamathensis goyatoka]|uniref:N-acetylmuramoyl-L-alanine amidase n=1 Tax=Rhinichthys klamathensis goyatoka TaxID=3034132 RepID=UPI0024B55F07|nr:N-acetylmuramoyl-L-alanine amidase [Rhinichthys klamathensis goyatoka]
MTPGALWIITMSGMCIVIQSSVTTVHLRNMENFITAVTHLEGLNPRLSPLALMTSLHKIADQSDNIANDFLESSDNRDEIHYKNNSFTELLNINHNLSNFFKQAIHYFITDGHEERGVVLTPDGTTIALAPLLSGLESGLRVNEYSNQPHGFYLLPLAKNLGLSFLQFRNTTPPDQLGPDGCWDSVSAPMVFTLSGVPSLATDALVHGGMDGAILGKHLSVVNSTEINLSTLLRSYYSATMEESDHVSDTLLRGRYRRHNFKKITNSSLLQKKVAHALDALQQHGDIGMEILIEKGIKEFVLRYMECPAIIPRCIWGAAPPQVPLAPLSPPLQYLYIHHTQIPSKPCLNLQTCSKNMRAMQHFHQKERGWYDLGYSFVVGSDGYIYEGRGWMWAGAHTKGRNTVGYGVAFIGSYSTHLPYRYDMELVHHHLVKCGVSNGFLQENYTILGHRQVVATDCPGDSLYSEITTWEHYKDTDPLK